MPSPGLIARLTRAEKSLAKLRQIGMMAWEDYASDEDAQALAERHLHIVLEAILDLASFIAARLNLARGITYRDVLYPVVEHLGLEKELKKMAQAIPGMRNILVHGYAEVRHDLVYETLAGELDKLEKLLRALWRQAAELDP